MIDVDLPVYTRRQLDKNGLVEVVAPVELITTMSGREVRRVIYAVGKTRGDGTVFGGRQCVEIDGKRYVLNELHREWKYRVALHRVITTNPVDVYGLEASDLGIDLADVPAKLEIGIHKPVGETLEVERADGVWDLAYAIGMTPTNRLRVGFRGAIRSDGSLWVMQRGKMVRRRGEDRWVKGDVDVIKTYWAANVLGFHAMVRSNPSRM